ncbi:MAG: SWIM zinc finger family protein [Candidatus Aenigmatarchaeota archaeon]
MSLIEQKGLNIFKDGGVKKEVETDRRIHFKVIGETDTHSVIYDKKSKKFSCDCKYSSLDKGICSHVVAAKMLYDSLTK